MTTSVAPIEPPVEPLAIAPDASLLLVRLSAIGDIVFASPLIHAFRRAYPEAHIAWLAQPECRALLDRHPDLNEVIVCPMQRWRGLLRERRLGALRDCIATLRDTLHARGFDVAVDLQGLLKSGMLARLSGAPQRIGLGSREGSQWLMTRTIERGGDPRRIGSEYLYLAQALGLPTDDFAMAVHYSPDDAAFVTELVERERLGGYAVLCPFTTRPQKHWIESRWTKAAERIQSDLGLTPVLLGGPADTAAAERIVDTSDSRIVNLAGQTSLTQAAAMIARASLLVAVDTGLGHMGIAFGTPSLLLFGSTCPYLDTTRANARVLYHALSCSPCKRRPTCAGAFDCMRAIEVDEVLKAARQVIGTPP